MANQQEKNNTAAEQQTEGASEQSRKQSDRNLNITLRNEEEGESIIISFSAFWAQLKRFFLIWLVLAIIAGIMVPVFSALTASDQHKNLEALVSFNFDGIEKGLAPDGSKFDANTLKSPAVIEAALTELGEPVDKLESIRQGITIRSILPTDAIDQITVYKSIFEQGSLNAGEKLLATSYYPTQYQITFNYARAGYSADHAVEVINMVLTKYTDYFFHTYGFNQALGNAVTALDYKNYDYAQAVEVFDSNLEELQSYVNGLMEDDMSRFRSSKTGFSFADLYQAITTLRTVDLDLISSYITVNTVTKDKDTLLDYYNYQIEKLARERLVQQEKLNSINESITNYEKDTIIIYSDMQDTSQYTQASAQYDSMVKQKIETQNLVSTKTSQIGMYQQRINTLKSGTAASQAKVDKVEADLAELNAKVVDMLEKVNATANEYYETVSLANSYTVLVPASTSGLSTTRNVIKSSMEPLLILEAVLFVVYFGTAFVLGLIVVNHDRKYKAPKTEAAEAAKQE